MREPAGPGVRSEKRGVRWQKATYVASGPSWKVCFDEVFWSGRSYTHTHMTIWKDGEGGQKVSAEFTVGASGDRFGVFIITLLPHFLCGISTQS